MPVERPAKPEYAKAVERLLASELLDTEREVGASMSLNSNDASFEDPRVCDLAAYAMSQQWPKKYHYRHVPSRRLRDAMRFQCLNAWRVGEGLPAIPEPHRPAFRKMPADPNIARRIACTVRTVQVRGDPWVWFAGLASQARGLKGQPLTADLVRNLLLSGVRRTPKRAVGFHFLAERDEDGAGIDVTIEFGRLSDRSDGGWGSTERVTAGATNLLNSGGSSSEDYMQSGAAFADIISAVHKALASPPRTPLYISEVLNYRPERNQR